MIKPLVLAATTANVAATPAFAEDYGTELKSAALSALQALFTDYSEEGVRTYFSPDVIQHNPFVPTGRDALIAFLPGLEASGITWTNHRILQDGDFVVMHNSFTNAEALGAPEIVTIDIYRMEDGQIAEHWDAIQPLVPETASGRSMVNGPTEITDLELTEENKAKLAAAFDVFINGTPEEAYATLQSTFHVDYIQHNPDGSDGIEGFLAAQMSSEVTPRWQFTKQHKMIGEGNYVLAISEGNHVGVHSVFYDLVRFEDGKVAEHWDVIQAVPTEGLANDNTMFNFN
ncbi:nuclear transport factor 2 family protein [Roseobacteraceae bacterium S113]